VNTARHWLTVSAIGLLAVLPGGRRDVLAQDALERFEGILQIVWADPHPQLGSGGEIRYSIALPDGRQLRLQLAEPQSVSPADFRRRMVVTGRRVAGPLTTTANAPGPDIIDVTTIVRSPVPQDEQVAPAAVLGTRRVIYLTVKFSDDLAVPHPPSFFADLNNPETPPAGSPFPATVNGFFAKTSWGQFSWLGDVGGVGGLGAPGGWLMLPHPKSYYAPCGWSSVCFNHIALSADAVALAKAEGISFTPYDNINFVLSNDLDCCAWGGSYFLDGKLYGATWEPPWGQEAGVYVHEMGHSIGLPHSGWVYYAYDSPWDMMSARRSANTVPCGSYFSANDGATRSLSCTEPGDGYIAPHKDVLGWIPSGNLIVTNALSSGTWTLEGGALPLGSGAKMIKVCLPALPCSGAGARYFTIEARVKSLAGASQYDNAIPGEGIVIQEMYLSRPPIGGSCYFNNTSGWALPIDSTPGDYDTTTCSFSGQTALYNAQWVPGQTYTNSVYGFSVAVVSRSGSTFLVSVAPAPRDPPSGFSKVSPVHGAGGQPNSVSLSWNQATGATTYEYCYDTSNDGACSAWSVAGTTTSVTVSNLAGNTAYFWQVRASNSGGTTYANGGPGSFWSFSTAASPGSFSKAAPGNGITGVALNPTLTWGASAAASSYQYCIDTSNDGACGTWTSTGGNTSAGLSGLSAGTTYYWQVRALNGLGTVYADGGVTSFWSFTTVGAVPDAFTKVSPGDNAVGQPTSLTLNWNPSSGATSYEYCYDTSANGICDTGWSSVGASLTTTVSGLIAGTTYSWQARARNANGTTPANGGTWWTFSTQGPVTITTVPAGRSITVDGTDYTSPQTFSWPAGSQHQIATSSAQVNGGTRYVFAGWSDGGTMSHVVTIPAGTTTYTATFRTEYLLTTSISPLAAGTVGASPVSSTGFYPAGSSVQLTAAPRSRYTFLGWSGDLSGSVNPQVVTLNAPRSVTASFTGGTGNLIQNGDFNLGLDYWTPFAAPDMSYLEIRAVTSMVDRAPASGALLFYKRPSPSGPGSQGGVFQTTGTTLPAMTPVSAEWTLANNSTARKRISVALVDADFSDMSVCSFWLAPASPRRTYRMRAHTTKAWNDAAIYFYAETDGSDGGYYQVDDVWMYEDPTGSTTRTDCVDPSAPSPAGDADGPNLLVNGDFGAGLSPWTTAGAIVWQVAGGVFEFYRPAGTPPGAVQQETAHAVSARRILTAQVQLGNTSGVRKRVTVQLRDHDHSDLIACSFWLPPLLPLSSYSVRGFTSQSWTNATLSVHPETIDNEEWVQLDMASLQETPNTAIVGTECVESGPAPTPAFKAATRTGPFESDASSQSGPPAHVRAPAPLPAAPRDADAFTLRSGQSWVRAGRASLAKATATETSILQWRVPLDAGVTRARLTFQSQLSTRASWGEVQTRTGGGAWLTSRAVPAQDGSVPVEVECEGLSGEPLDVRFVFHAIAPPEGTAADTWRVDDLQLEYEPRQDP
jgi:M6 family metalloprotease-like protein